MLQTCTINSINKITSTPNFQKALKTCSQNFTYINYLSLHYNSLNKNYSILLLLLFLLIPLLFLNIKHISENFFSKSINQIRKFFKIPSIIFASTLLPFINGIPDLMVAIVSAGISDGLNIVIGSLLGSFVFSASLIIFFVVFYSGRLFLDRLAFLKDLFFYFFAVVCVLLFGVLRIISRVYVFLFFAVYVVYLVLGFFFFREEEFEDLEDLYFKGGLRDARFKGFDKSENQIFKRIHDQTMNLDTSIKSRFNVFDKKSEERAEVDKEDFIKEVKKDEVPKDFENQVKSDKIDKKNIKNIDNNENKKIQNNKSNIINNIEKNNKININNNDENNNEKNIENKDENNNEIDIEKDILKKNSDSKIGSNNSLNTITTEESLDNINNINITELKNIFSEKTEFSLKKTFKSLCSEKSFFLNYILFPFKLLYLLSTPYKKNPLLKTRLKYIIIFFSLSTTYFFFKSKKILIFSLSTTILLTLIFQIKKINLQKKKIIYNFLTIISSISWINFYTTILLDSIFYISFLLNINKTFLSMIIISLGNCTGDLFSGIALAKNGDGILAFFSTFSGQIFNVFVGIGCHVLLKGDFRFFIFEVRTGLDFFLMMWLFFFVFAVLVLHLFYAVIKGFVYDRSFFWGALGFLIVFVGTMIAVLVFN